MISIHLSRKQIWAFFLTLLLLDAWFICASSPIGAQWKQAALQDPIKHFFLAQMDLKEESDIATWYSSILLFVAGAFALLNGTAIRGSEWRNRLAKVGWTLVALLFIGLSADEVGQVHERTATLYNWHLSRMGEQPVKLGAGDWMPLLMPLIVASAVGLMAFLSLMLFRNKVCWVLSFAGLACWVGVLLTEANEASPSPDFQWERAAEEALEIVGTTLFVIAFAESLRKLRSAEGGGGSIPGERPEADNASLETE